VGQGERAAQGVAAAASDGPSEGGALEYRLGEGVAKVRARAAALLGGATSLAPVVLAIVLLRRLGWGPSGPFWAVAVALGVLVAVRQSVAYGAMYRRLRALVVVVADDGVRVATAREATAIVRANVARVVEVEGSLGGLRIEARADGAGTPAAVVQVPRGGVGFAEVRARLERWGRIERRSRRGPAVRVAIGAAIVVAFFFTPFLLEDFVARSKFFAAALVIGMWVAMRMAMRGR
jgi:hypothetical protein